MAKNIRPQYSKEVKLGIVKELKDRVQDGTTVFAACSSMAKERSIGRYTILKWWKQFGDTMSEPVAAAHLLFDKLSVVEASIAAASPEELINVIEHTKWIQKLAETKLLEKTKAQLTLLEKAGIIKNVKFDVQ